MIINKKGFAVFFVTILVLMAMFGIVMNIALVAFFQAQIIRNITRSNQAYFASESGAEDALLRMRQKPSSSAQNYTLAVGSASDMDLIRQLEKDAGAEFVVEGEADFDLETKKMEEDLMKELKRQGVDFK